MRIARVFPRMTKASPIDDLAFFGEPGLFPVEADEAHVSVAFTADIPRAEHLARAWERVAPVRLGGPAYNQPGGNFEPGRYLRQGYVITSRGCPNRCKHCSVPQREGRQLRELPITEGWNVLDDNLLACSEAHIRNVFAMLQCQPHRAEFTGGLEAARLKSWHVDLLCALKPKQMFFAYDDAGDREPLFAAGRMLQAAGFSIQSHKLRAYVLIGQDGDTFTAAEQRLEDTIRAGFMPQAMLWMDEKGHVNQGWKKFRHEWSRPKMIGAKIKKLLAHSGREVGNG